MKVIVVTDDDGHTHAIAYTAENMLRCLKHLLAVGRIEEHCEIAKQILAGNLAAPYLAKAVEDIVYAEHVSGHGYPLNFVEVQDSWEFRYGPFS